MRRLLCLIAVVALGLGTAAGQTTSLLTVDIPFDFYLRDQPMPRGEYRIVQVDSNALQLRRVEDGRALFAATFGSRRPASASANSFVSFLKYDNDHIFLRQIWHASMVRGWDVNACRMEREHVRSRIITSVRPETTVVLARTR